MNFTEFKKTLQDKKISKDLIKKINESFYEKIIDKKINSNNVMNLFIKINSLLESLTKSQIKTNTKGMVTTKNVPKLIETFFEQLNELNIYYLQQNEINEIVKYMNKKLQIINPDVFFDKKIFKRMLFDIKNSDLKLEHDISLEEDYLVVKIILNIKAKTHLGNEKFELVFDKKIKFNEDFEQSKWNFYYWTLNDFVNELKACNKWYKTK